MAVDTVGLAVDGKPRKRDGNAAANGLAGKEFALAAQKNNGLLPVRLPRCEMRALQKNGGSCLTRRDVNAYETVVLIEGEKVGRSEAALQRCEVRGHALKLSDSARRELLVRSTVVKRADALVARRVGRHIERRSELLGSRAKKNGLQIAGLKISDRWMKEAGPHRAIDFNNSRDPRRIAYGRKRFHLAEVRAERARDLAEIFGRFRDEAAGEICHVNEREMVQLLFEGIGFIGCQSDLALPCNRPQKRPIESVGRSVHREKRNAIQTDLVSCLHRRGDVKMVRFLDCAAGGDAHMRAMRTDCGDSFSYEFECTRHTTDGVMYSGWAIDGDNHIVEACRDFFCALLQQEAGRQQRKTNV